MKTLTWLHISDLHFDPKDRYNQQFVLAPLIEEMKHRVEQGWRFDAVFCTGDVGNHGGAYDPATGTYPEYEAACDFFDQLLCALQLPKDRLYVVPGNHDVDRSTAHDYTFPDDRDEANQVLGDVRAQATLLERFRGFRWFLKHYLNRDFCPGGKAFSTHSFTTSDGLSVGVLELNSSWMAVGKNDQGNLVIGERPVWEGLAAAAPSDSRPEVLVGLVHHPLDWVKWWDREQVQALLEGGVDLLLRGHLHSGRVENMATQFGSMVAVAAGAAYQTRKWPSRVVIGRLDYPSRTVWSIPLKFEDQGRGGWQQEWSPSQATGGPKWKVNPPTQQATALIQQGLWEISETAITDTVNNLALTAPPHKIIHPEEVTDWDERQAIQTAWFKELSSTTRESPHFVVFSSASIPLAVHLGYLLTDRYPVTFFQWDRFRNTWHWEQKFPENWDASIHIDGVPLEVMQAVGPVAIRVSISDVIQQTDVAVAVPQPIASIHVRLQQPNRGAITSEKQVHILGQRFREVLDQVRFMIPNCSEVHLFCAVPTAVAVNLGRQISKTMDPVIRLYQHNRKASPSYAHVLNLD